MTQEQIDSIEATIAACEAQGIAWTNLLVYEAVKPVKYQSLSAYLKQRRAHQASPSVLDEPEPPLDTSPTLEAPTAAEDGLGATIGMAGDSQDVREPDGLPDDSLGGNLGVAENVPRLIRLQQVARVEDEQLIRLTYARDQQQVRAQTAALAVHQGRREAQALLTALRQAQQRAAGARPWVAASEQEQVQQLQAELAALVGAAEAQRCALDRTYRPGWTL